MPSRGGPKLRRAVLENGSALCHTACVVLVNAFHLEVREVAVLADLASRDGVWTSAKHEGYRPGPSEDPLAPIGLGALAVKHA